MHSNRDKEEMDSGGEIEGVGDENEFPSSAVRGRKYSPVVAHDSDRAVLEMSSIDPRSSSSPYSKQDLKYTLSLSHFFLLILPLSFVPHIIFLDNITFCIPTLTILTNQHCKNQIILVYQGLGRFLKNSLSMAFGTSNRILSP